MGYSENLVDILIDNLIKRSYCPDSLGLEVKDFESECNEERNCEDCWKEALKEGN